MREHHLTFSGRVNMGLWVFKQRFSSIEMTWWRHDMEPFPRYWPFVRGIHPSPVKIPRTKASRTRSFDVFFDLRLNKRLSKQSWGWWFETPSQSWCRHRNDNIPLVHGHCLLHLYQLKLFNTNIWIHTNEMNTEKTWWRHQMETFSALLAFCAENSPVTGEFPTQRPVTRRFDVFFDLRLNKQLSKQSWS